MYHAHTNTRTRARAHTHTRARVRTRKQMDTMSIYAYALKLTMCSRIVLYFYLNSREKQKMNRCSAPRYNGESKSIQMNADDVLIRDNQPLLHLKDHACKKCVCKTEILGI